jgi:hypothetical protein
MNKKERTLAAALIRYGHTIDIGKRFELKLPCGMTVRCDNTEEARDRMAARFEKRPYNMDSSKLLNRRLWR